MQPLDKGLRNRLEKAVKDARTIAEAAAQNALEELGVGEISAPKHLVTDKVILRRRLRIHSHQLGDHRESKSSNPDLGSQDVDRLIEEVAYEHWHRMLFARILAENNLLMYPDPDNPVAITLEECEDLAADEGAKNGWELAARFAARMLPQIFRPDSPVFQLALPPEHQQKLEQLLTELPAEVFTASDSLGWVYQFWQAKKKDEINASEVKIGARELPAVTQLFTEPYMVAFLLDNSLGAWWAARRLTEADLRNAKSEEELRRKAALPGMPLEYLRFVRVSSPLAGEGKGEGEIWTPAAGTFDGWPKHLSELKTLDPCCGSGHFLVAAFLMLVAMRMELEGLSAREAVDAVLRENIHGLEIDKRCVELAAFALALTAWCYPSAGGYRALPELNVACSGLAISAKKEEWLALAGDNTNLRMVLEELYKQFRDAPVLGSLINLDISRSEGSLFEVKLEDFSSLLFKALSSVKDDEKIEMGVIAQGIARSANILSRKFDFVFTNVPYLGFKKMDPILKVFCEKNYSKTKADLATVMLERCIQFCSLNGVVSAVTPQTFSFLGTFIDFRKDLLENCSMNAIAKLGTKAFQTQLYDFHVSLFQIVIQRPIFGHSFFVVDISKDDKPERSIYLKKHFTQLVNQGKQLDNPDYRIITDEVATAKLLENYAISKRGIVNGDNERWLRGFSELEQYDGKWRYIQLAVNRISYYSGRHTIINWSTNGDGMLRPGLANPTYGKSGVAVSRMAKLPCTIYTGEFYDQNTAILVPNKHEYISPLWCFATDVGFNEEVRKLDQKVGVTPATLLKIPFDLDHWTKIAQEKYPKGLPKPYSDDPTQWIFHGHPAKSDAPLQVAVARLLGYRWPAELDSKMELSDEARALLKKSESLLSYADEDGIVCIPPARGEASAADRLLNLLAAAYGDSWSNDKLSELLKEADHAGKTLETWLREKFFTQHCKLFHHRPFIWHIWDGLRDGFGVLVNYHKLDRKNLETLIYTYIGDWISRQKQDKANGVDGADERLSAAEVLKKRLELILKGEGFPDKDNPEKSYGYDIFVRWKPIDKQPIGWNPDINDGVRLNIRPFMSVPDVGKKGAGVLRDKPNIDWKKDRGKDVESAPWYHLFKGDRINDYHLSLEEKKIIGEI